MVGRRKIVRPQLPSRLHSQIFRVEKTEQKQRKRHASIQGLESRVERTEQKQRIRVEKTERKQSLYMQVFRV